MAELTATWMLGCVCGFFMGVTVAGRRRPKPPSLKEQALEALKHAEEGWRPVPADCEIIRRALEQLDD